MKNPGRCFLIGCSILAILLALHAGCRNEQEPEPDPPGSQVRPLSMQFQAAIHTHAWAWGSEARVAFNDPTLFVPNGAAGLSIYSLHDPGHPEHLATMETQFLGGQGGAVAADNKRAFVALADKGLIAELDISVPSSPVLTNHIAAMLGCQQLALRGSHLFANFGPSRPDSGGVLVFDVSRSPAFLVGQYTGSDDPGFCVSASKRVFLARQETLNWTAEVDVIAMANPEYPSILCTWHSSRLMNIWDMCLVEGRLYCAAYLGGIIILKETDQSLLDMEAQFDWSEVTSGAWSITALHPYVFVARGDANGAPGSFQAFRQDGGMLTLVWEQAAEFPVHSVAVANGLLVTVEQEPPTTSLPKKTLKLYRIFAE